MYVYKQGECASKLGLMWIIIPNIQTQGRELEFCTAKILVHGCWATAYRAAGRRYVAVDA